MRIPLFLAAAAVLASLAGCTMIAMAQDSNGKQTVNSSQPIVIGHRGASGYVPEHTLSAYFIAIEQGADFIEPDLVMTRDKVLVARHENEISGTTDVADRPEFASRKATKVIDGVSVTGWFSEDFTLAELKRLRARERLPRLRPGNTRFDRMFEIPTFEEILTLVRAVNTQRELAARRSGAGGARLIGIYPETKHPSYFDRLGLSMEEPLVRALHAHGYVDSDAPVFIQSFETANLKELSSMTRLRRVLLLDSKSAPYDLVFAGDSRSAADLITPQGLTEVAKYAHGIGANKNLIIPRVDGQFGQPTRLVTDAHAQGLLVHVWTFRAENEFLPEALRRGADVAQHGDLAAEIAAFLAAGIDGLFTDHPDLGVRARDAFLAGD